LRRIGVKNTGHTRKKFILLSFFLVCPFYFSNISLLNTYTKYIKKPAENGGDFMDEKVNDSGKDTVIADTGEKTQEQDMKENAQNIRKFAMDDAGRIRREDVHPGRNGAAVVAGASKIYIVLGWVCAALAAFIHPFFAVAGIIFGVLVNRHAIGRGTAIIISNIVLAAINIILGMFLIAGG
jgi:hypothetical protein